MLIEFSVANYRSFRERQTFSMVAAPRLQGRGNTFPPDLLGEKFPSLLKVAVIYGPNASGKSNLLMALDVINHLIYRPPTAEYALPVSPFRFDPLLVNGPSEFEIHFIVGGIRYIFETKLSRDRFFLERLTFFPKGKEALLYERKHSPDGERYHFGEILEKEAGADILETWRKLTAPQSLFIVQAVANSSEDLKLLRKPHKWLQRGMRSVLSGMRGIANSSRGLIADDETQGDSLAAFLDNVDIPISKVRSAKVIQDNALLNLHRPTEKPQTRITKTVLTHRSALGDAEFDFEDESEGTKNLIGFWLPWSIRVPNSKNNISSTMLVDELDASLHPNIVSKLVRQLIEAEVPSQLIFSSHDTHLMDTKILRRDQIWLTERDINGATKLRSIHDFEGREGEDVEKRYYEGRYRGLPILKGG